LRHAVRTEKVDREVPFKIGTIAQVIVKVHSGVLIKISSASTSRQRPESVRVGHVQSQGRDAAIEMSKGLARSRIHPLGASLQGFSTNARPMPRFRRDQDCFVFDVYNVLLPNYVLSIVITHRSAGRIRPRPKDFGIGGVTSWLDGGLTVLLLDHDLKLSSQFLVCRLSRS